MTGMSSRPVTVDRGMSNGGRKCRMSHTISSRNATASTPVWTSQNRQDLTGRRNLSAASRKRPGTARIGLAMSALAIAHAQQLGRDGTHHRLGARTHPELGVDVVAVPVHGARADAQLSRDLAVVQTRSQKRQDPELTLAEVAGTMLGLARGDQQPGGETGLENARPTSHGTHGLDQFLARSGLA